MFRICKTIIWIFIGVYSSIRTVHQEEGSRSSCASWVMCINTLLLSCIVCPLDMFVCPGSGLLLQGKPFPLQETDPGFDTGDYVLNHAAKILRLLYIHDLRDLQTRINECIVAVQSVTANPKTDTKLGKVGKWNYYISVFMCLICNTKNNSVVVIVPLEADTIVRPPKHGTSGCSEAATWMAIMRHHVKNSKARSDWN